MENIEMEPSGRPIAIAGVALLHLLVSVSNAVAFGGNPPNDEWAMGWFFGTPFAQSSLLAVWVALVLQRPILKLTSQPARLVPKKQGAESC